MGALGSTLCRGPMVWGNGVWPHQESPDQFPQHLSFPFSSDSFQIWLPLPRSQLPSKNFYQVFASGQLHRLFSTVWQLPVQQSGKESTCQCRIHRKCSIAKNHDMTASTQHAHIYVYIHIERESFPGGQQVKNRPEMQETGDMDAIPGSRKIPWKRKMVTHSSILA